MRTNILVDRYGVSQQVDSFSDSPSSYQFPVINDLLVLPSTQERFSKRLHFFHHESGIETNVHPFSSSDVLNSGLPGQNVGSNNEDVDGPSCSSQTPQQAFSNVAYRSSGLSSSQVPPSAYSDLGDCDQLCEYCGALFWYAERLKGASTKERPKYNRCCKRGQVKLSRPLEPPEVIKQLFKDKKFMENIRAYNSMFSMTSFGANVDDSINNGLGPYVFKVEGQISHWMGSLCPPEDQNPRFLQMYIYDTGNEVCNRLRYFGGDQRGDLKPEVVKTLIHVLDEVNDLVKLFRTARDMCLDGEPPEFKIRLYHNRNQMNYNAPKSGTLGAIVYDSGPRTKNDFDMIIQLKDGVPQRVSKLHPSYMALQFLLLFLFGEHGWSPELKLVRCQSRGDKRLSMNMFYSYQLHDRFNLYALLPRGGRLFQQYLVNAYICIEQNRLDYIESNQDTLRNEYLQGVHDALLRGDSDGHDIGKRTILPASFTGGPRYMYKHYQDALAICRVHGNPQYFITYTCNVRWPEVM